MKRLFSVFMLAAIATLTFAFTTPKSDAAFATTYYWDGNSWEVGEADSCPGSTQACQFTAGVALNSQQLLEAASQITANPSRTTVTVTGIAQPVSVSDISLRP